MTFLLLALIWLIALVYSPFILSCGFEDAFELKRTVLEMGALALVSLLPFYTSIRSLRFLRNPQIFLPIVYVAYLALHVLFIVPSRVAELRLYEMFCLLVIFLAGIGAGQQEDALLRLLRGLVFAAAAVAVYALWQVFQGHEPYSTIGNRNFVAFFVMAALPSTAFSLREAAKKRFTLGVILYALVAVVILICLIVCKSKAAWLALAATCFVMAALRRKYKIVAWMALGFAIAGVFLPVERMVTDISTDVRPYLWSGAWEMGKSAPWFGVGLGHFFIQIPFFRSPEYFLLAKSADTTLHAHNEILQIFSETGLIGVVLFISSVGMIFFRTCFRGISGVLAASICAMAIKSCFDMDLQIVSSEFIFWLILGLACGRSLASDENPSRDSSAWPWNVLSIAIAACLFVQYSLPFIRSQWLERMAADRAKNGRWEEAQRYCERASRLEPGLVKIPFRLGYAFTRTGNWDKAMECYRVVRATAPYYSDVLFNMAAVCRQHGKFKEAMLYLQEGFRMNPYSLQGHSIAEEVYLLTGQTREARREVMIREAIKAIRR